MSNLQTAAELAPQTAIKKKNEPLIRRVKEEMSYILKTKYNLSLIEKKKDDKKKQKQEKKTDKVGLEKQVQIPKVEGKFEIKTPKGTRDYYPDQMAIRRKVINSIVEVFQKHGAVQIDTPVFQLKEVLTGKYGQDSKLIYDLDDQGGEKCALRYDLTVPFARFMAMNTNIQKIKRFHIGKVYRRDQPSMNKGRFREFYQCDFDIAGKLDQMISDAEVVAIMQEILQELSINEFLVKINHRQILQAMILQAGCHKDLFKTICSSVDKLDKQPWAEVRAQLLTKGVTEDQAEILGKLTSFKGQPLKLLDQLMTKNVFSKNKELLELPFENMRKLFTYLTAMNRCAKVSFDLSLARGLDYYTGIIFQIVLTDKTTELGSISGGGRYDNLIGMFSQHPIPSIGGSIGIERLFTILEDRFKGKVKQNPCQVLVATIGKIEVADKLSVLADLWRGNIKAETLYHQRSKADKQINHAFQNQIPMILWLGQEELKTREAKLKILYKHEQFKVSLENLSANLMPYILQFRKDFQEGKVQLQDPKKVKK